MKKTGSKILAIAFFLTILIGMAACARKPAPAPEQTPTVHMQPTPTEAPMAARVNGEGLLLVEYEAELQRYQAAAAQLNESADVQAASQAVLDELIGQILLAQAAAQQNFVVDDATLQSRYETLQQSAGGSEALQTWMGENFYTEESFRLALKRNIAAAWMRDQIMDATPASTEQVHARQILVDSQNEAEAILRQLQVGAAFETLTVQYDPLTGGELGWFPRGYLLQAEVENAAFSLEPGSFSGIIASSYGFHIIEVLEKDPAHALSPDALLFVQRAELEKWLQQQRASAAIEVLIP